jgi:HK97 family phage major capsid protein
MFFNEIITKTYEQGKIAKEVFRLPVSESNGITIPLIDEQSRANGFRWGGVKSVWLGEGGTTNYTAPKFRQLELKLNRVATYWAVTQELLDDAPVVSAIAQRAFSEELLFVLEDMIFNGDGNAKGHGVMSSPALYSQARQTANSVTYQDISNMFSHMWPGSLPNAKWYFSQSVMPQLLQLQLNASTTLSFPMWVAPGDGDKPPKTMLLGHEVVIVEQAQQLGTQGDIVFADLSQYVVAEKSTPQFMASPHVLFLSAEMAYRLIWRLDGNSMWATTLSPAYGSYTMSPFIALHA